MALTEAPVGPIEGDTSLELTLQTPRGTECEDFFEPD